MKKGLSLALVLFLMATFIPAAIAAAPEPNFGLIPQYGSNGNFLAPIEPIADYTDWTAISDRAGLEAMANKLDGKYYLTQDIDLSGEEWIPIGGNSSVFDPNEGAYVYQRFSGIFDGQGCVIHNLTITGEFEYAGLFGVIENATVRNVGLEDTNIDIDSDFFRCNAGGVCGANLGDSAIANCYNIGAIAVDTSSSTGASSSYVGGICGYYESSSKNSSTTSTIINCYNEGTLSASSSYSSYAGGVCGYYYFYTENFTIVSNCYNNGKVSAVSDNENSYAGGIFGAFHSRLVIKNCINEGDISAFSSKYVPFSSSDDTANAGGLFGYVGSFSNSTILNCCNKGNVVSTAISSHSCAGGIGGRITSEVTINNCYNIGDLSASVSEDQHQYTKSTYAGGISGYADYLNVKNFFNTGNVSGYFEQGEVYIGGVSGYVYYGILENCYWNSDSEQTANGINLTKKGIRSGTDNTAGLTNEQMKVKKSFSGFDFITVWGINEAKNDGYPYLLSMTEPVFRQISVGGNHATAIMTDGTLWAWGENSSGELGNGGVGDIITEWEEIFQSVPAQIGSDDDWKSVAAGIGFTVAIKTDGSLWVWGDTGSGQKDTPTRIGTDNNWASIAANLGRTMAIKTDGSLWGWGYNGECQLGDGTTDYRDTPTQIGNDYDWASVSAGSRHTTAIKTDGSLWAWGWNYTGQLGDSEIGDTYAYGTLCQSTPIQIGTDTDWESTSAGVHSTYAIKADGSLWSFGSSWYGGTGRIGTDNDWVSVVSNGERNNWGSTVAIKDDGSLWAWGFEQNDEYEVTWNNTPARIGTDNDWASASVSCWGSHRILLKNNGSLWGWANGYSSIYLGDGKEAEYSSDPILIWVKPWQVGDTLIPSSLQSNIFDNIQILPAASGNGGNVDFKANFNTPISNITFYVAIYEKNGKLYRMYQAYTSDNSVESLTVSDIPKEQFNKNVKLLIWDKNTMEPYIKAVNNY